MITYTLIKYFYSTLFLLLIIVPKAAMGKYNYSDTIQTIKLINFHMVVFHLTQPHCNQMHYRMKEI